MGFVKKLKVASTISQQGGTVTTGGTSSGDIQVIPGIYVSGKPITEADLNAYAELLGCAAEQYQICQDLLLHTPTVYNVQLTETTVKNISITLNQKLPMIAAANVRGIQK